MGQPSYGPTIRKRAKRLVEALLAYVNYEIEDWYPSELKWRWKDGDSHELIVETTVEVLKELTRKYDAKNALKENNIKESLQRLEDLGFLEDNRSSTQGSKFWHFTLSLWSRDKSEILQQFDGEWECRKPGRSEGDEPDPTAVPSQFQSLINDKTEGFVGRDYVFEAIDRFLESQPNGYFTIEADPGVGKSAILAEYVRRNRCLAHFNVRSQGINRSSQLLESVCKQLVDRYDLPYSTLPADATRDGTFLGQLLGEIGAKLQDSDRLIVAIDALDEVDLASQEAGTNILYLPMVLPRNVYFILTRRPVTLPFQVQAPQYLFDLMSYQQESFQDVQVYIRRESERPQLRQWIGDRELTVDEFVIQLGTKSENNFMYIRYVLPEIERGFYQDLSIDSLPKGLEGYYEDHWVRMGMRAKPLPRTKLEIVYILGEIRQPVSRQLISEYANKDELTVQEVLDDWEQFLHEQDIEEQTCYSIYHSSFQDFLHRKDIVKAAGVTVQGINAMIADRLWEGLFGDE